MSELVNNYQQRIKNREKGKIAFGCYFFGDIFLVIGLFATYYVNNC